MGALRWDFQTFLFDNNEGGCTDVFFFDQNTGLVSGTVFDGRGAIARTTDAGVSWSTLFFDQAIQGLIFHSQPAGLRWARADESYTARTLELPGPTRPVGPPPISTTFPWPATRCEGSQLATAARFLDSKRRRTGADPDADSNSQCYSDSYPYRDTAAYSDAKGSSHTATSSV